MIHVIGTIRSTACALDEIRPALEEMVTATRAEPGCIAYSYAVDALDPAVIHLIERWRTREALEAHFVTPHMAAWRSVLSGRQPGERALMLYESGEGTPL